MISPDAAGGTEGALEQLDTLRNSAALARDLDASTPIRERDQSSRAVVAEQTLEQLMGLLPLAGISRVANISHLAPVAYPVYQSTRPSVFSHAFLGQNTGAQGRGCTLPIAQLSSIMETLEMHSAEPRNAWLVRGSYDFLSQANLLLPAERFVAAADTQAPATRSEPILWTPAYSVEHRIDMLVPAELVHYGLNARDYQTRPIFPASSNGLGAGSSLVEAALHGLYELVERHYIECWLCHHPDIVVERLEDGDGFGILGWSEFQQQHPHASVAVLALRFSGLALNLANVICAVIEDGEFCWGSACHQDVDTAVSRALGEALQSKPTSYAGSREDIVFRNNPTGKPGESTELPPQVANALAQLFDAPRTLSLSDFRSVATHARHATLQEEFYFVCECVHQLGYPDVFVKNLTRVSLEVPVVRVLVPGLLMQSFCISRQRTFQETIQCQYSLDL